ncbi:MAG: GPR endopeptidase [Lachnospiraceae bacterium]|nr:GPR endopeptidase [Lachnospiraceae bacterium]
MRNEIEIRTDLAVESTEQLEREAQEISGVRIEREEREESRITITTVVIETEEGATRIGKPVGNYITIEAEGLREPEGDIMEKVAQELATQLLGLFRQVKNKQLKSMLVVGLGNREITADALGPKVSNYLYATNHLAEENEIGISCLAPGVMAQTGMEVFDIIKGVAGQTKPDLILVVDALAARDTSRFNTTIQLADTGISPGSGVGNHRMSLNEESIGVPVFAIGVPTVVDAVTIVSDAMDRLLEELAACKELKKVSETFFEFSPQEKFELVSELLRPAMGRMYVTPKDVDETVRAFAHIISAGIEMAVAAYNR